MAGLSAHKDPQARGGKPVCIPTFAKSGTVRGHPFQHTVGRHEPPSRRETINKTRNDIHDSGLFLLLSCTLLPVASSSTNRCKAETGSEQKKKGAQESVLLRVTWFCPHRLLFTAPRSHRLYLPSFLSTFSPYLPSVLSLVYIRDSL